MAIFIHVFKAGGTSLSDWLAQRYRTQYVPPEPMAFHEAAQKEPDFIRGHDLIRGHIYFRDALPFTDTHTTIALVRRPEAQLMSALWHTASHRDGSERENMPFREDLPALLREARMFRETNAAMQSVFFSLDVDADYQSEAGRKAAVEAVLEGVNRVDLVAPTECLSEAIRLFARRLGIRPPWRVPHARRSDAGAARMPAEIRELLANHLHFDGILYDAVCARFERDMEAARKGSYVGRLFSRAR